MILTFYKRNEKKKMKDEEVDGAARAIGCSPSTLKMSFANYDWIKTGGKKGLSNHSKLQKETFNKFYYLIG